MTHGAPAYGLWSLVVINTAVFVIFAFSFTRPRAARDWRSFGGFTAFLVALFTEMYGFPLTLAGFKVDPANGTLTPIGSVPTEQRPRGFAIDTSGRFLLAVGQLSHGLSSYAIDPASGQLTKLREYPMGENPNWIEIVDLP